MSDQHVQVEVRDIGASSLTLQRNHVISPSNGFPAIGQAAMIAIRPEKISLSDSRSDGHANVVQGTLQASQFLGDRYEYTVTLGSETRVIVSPEGHNLKPGEKIFLELKSEGISLWPREE